MLKIFGVLKVLVKLADSDAIGAIKKRSLIKLLIILKKQSAKRIRPYTKLLWSTCR